MKTVIRMLLGAFGLALVEGCAGPPVVPWQGEPAVILVSLDGFRADYLSRGVTPHLVALARAGVRAEAMHPSFPSITFPNHYTLVTGLRPDHHGVVGNTMFDPKIPDVRFTMGTHDARWWDEGEPAWVTAERQGLNVGTMFWPGSEVAIHGVRPNEVVPFDKNMSDDVRVDRLLSWYDDGARPRFSTLYFNAVDSAGHRYGPDSAEVNAALEDVDEGVGRLLAGLRARHIPADVIVVADHGMAGVGAGHVIALDHVAPRGSFRWVTGGAYAGVDAVAGHEAVLERALLGPHEHMRCWRKGDLPERFAYGRNPRVPGYICLADVGWVIERDDGAPEHPIAGDHGYDPMAPEMDALFEASGPDFVGGRVLAPFDNVDVYPLVMHLLGVRALPNDGSLTPFAGVLRR